MTPQLIIETFDTLLAERLAAPQAAAGPGELVLYWLGQAGFILDLDGCRVLLDPYLSDSLARKYRGTRFPHTRQMAAPITPEQLDRLDLVLCTHRHTDHMDPDTLQALAARFPQLRFVVPAASIDEARKRCGVGDERLIAVNAGDSIHPLPGMRVRPLPSAHETLQTNADGQHEWLGYVIDVAGLRLFHSGDCIPYAGQAAIVGALAPQVALLPVNGRDLERSGNGVPGNFTLDEAITLCRDAAIPVMVAHHYGMFDFNTVAPQVIDDRAAAQDDGRFALHRATTGWAMRLKAGSVT
jgi:L-ascorbate metabolism protein UlaG (beta-lactamase superfamily)